MRASRIGTTWLCGVTQTETQDFLNAFKAGLNDTVQFIYKYTNGDYERGNISTLTTYAPNCFEHASLRLLEIVGDVASGYAPPNATSS